MDANEADAAVAEFEKRQPALDAFKVELLVLLEKLIDYESLTSLVVHAEGRIKSLQSLKEKLGRPGKERYTKLDDVTDLCGIRIVVFYSDDVKRFEELIRREFQVLEAIDKKTSLGADQFGYRSVHFIVKLSSARLQQAENTRFRDFCAEVQVRSILQHAWAAMEHESYKSAQTVATKRRFARLAGLLELADEEFNAIRAESTMTASEVIAKIKTAPEFVEIDPVSLNELWKSCILRIDRRIYDRTGGMHSATWTPAVRHLAYGLEVLSKRARDNGFQDVEALEASVRSREDLLVAFACTYRASFLKARPLVTLDCLFALLRAEALDRQGISAGTATQEDVMLLEDYAVAKNALDYDPGVLDKLETLSSNSSNNRNTLVVAAHGAGAKFLGRPARTEELGYTVSVMGGRPVVRGLRGPCDVIFVNGDGSLAARGRISDKGTIESPNQVQVGLTVIDARSLPNN